MPERRSALLLYAGAGVVYIAFGVSVPSALLSWPLGASFLLVAVWLCRRSSVACDELGGP